MDDDDQVLIALDWCLRDIARLADGLADPERAWLRFWEWLFAYALGEPLWFVNLEHSLLLVARQVRAELQSAL